MKISFKDRLRLGRVLSARFWASAPPGAKDAYLLANRLRGRGTRRISASDLEARFMAEIGAVPVSALLVPKPMLSAARNAASQAAAELGSAVPQVRWFHNVKGGKDARGWFCSSFPGSVWISASLSTAKVCSTVRHECQHRADSLVGRPMTEKRARSFAGRYEPPSDGRAWAPRPTDFATPFYTGAWT